MIRSATQNDIPTLIDIECRAFGRNSTDERRGVEHRLQHAWTEYVLLEENGQCAASAHIARRRLRVGKCAILKGDVGHVAVWPELQGRGYGAAFMRQIISHMAANNFHVSRLGGLMKFYARFGYEPFLRRYIRIPVPRFDTHIKGQNWGELLQLSPELAARVRPYHPSRDHLAVHRLRHRFDATRSGQSVTDPEPSSPATGAPDPEGLVWVYDDGQVKGFLRGALGLVHAGDTAPSYRLDELAFSEPCAVGALVKTLMQRAQDRAPTILSCRLPYDETLFAALTSANIAFEIVEMHQAADGNMVRVINLPETLRAVEAELSDRLKTLPMCPWEGTVQLALPEQTATLRICRNGARITPDNRAEVTVKASQAEFLKWLFGISGFSEFPQARLLTSGQRLALGSMFPRLACASGPWG